MRTIVTFSGAGLSAESGIPTFRDSDGLWENHKIEDVASPEGWNRNKELVLKFYEQRFVGIKNSEPNAAHKALAKLEEKFNVINVTQNIDDLLERAGCSNVEHVHGRIDMMKCECHQGISNLDGDTNYTCTYLTAQFKPVVLGDLCPACGGQLRPHVVWFGEAVDLGYNKIADLVREVKYNDGVFICIGTSANVAPASLLVPFFAQVPKKYIVNLKTWPIADYDLREGPATVEVPKLVEELMEDA
jgi:NAD-dependent deacetylase